MPKPLTVIQVLPELNSGGVEKGTLEIAKFLVDNGHRSIVVSNGGRLVETLEQLGSEHIQAPIGKKSLLTLRYILWFKHLLQTIKPDIVHARSRLPAWVIYLAWKQMPKNNRPRFVTTFHGQHSVNRYSAIMTKGERVITVSNFMRQHILESYPDFDESKLEVIHRGVDTQLFNQQYQPNAEWLKQWHQDFPETKGKRLLVIPGRVSPRKGIDEFLRIFEKVNREVSDTHGLVIGEAHSSQTAYFSELKQLVTDLKLQDKISFTGHRSDIINLLSIASITYSLSNKPEAFGRTVTESISLGTPVMGYNIGGVGEQLSTLYPEGLIDPSNIEQAAHQSIKLLSNPTTMPKQIPYTLINMCEQTIKVYDKLLNAGKKK